jgi:type IX secretion system PorP/SprF family membrane protein
MHLLRFVLLLVFLHQKAAAQDFQFSQYYATPLLVNPALTGYMDGLKSGESNQPEVRFSAAYRNQLYRGVQDYNGAAIAMDWRHCLPACVNCGKSRSSWAIGGILQADGSRFASYRNIRAGLSGAYHLQLKNDVVLSAGASGSWFNFGFDPTALQLDQQFDGRGHNPGFGSPDPLVTAERSKSQLDLNAGANFSARLGKGQLTAGLALYHLKPIEYTLAGSKNQLGVGTGVYLTYEKTRVTLRGFYRRQSVWGQNGRQQQILAGPVFHTKKLPLGGGILFRANNHHRTDFALDGAVLITQLRLQGLQLQISYDIALSAVRTATSGAFELTMTHVWGDFKRCVYCPGL